VKMALPTRKDITYIKRKLKIWHTANKELNTYPELESKEFKRALNRLCRFFRMPIPKVSFYKCLGGFQNKILGQCTSEGEIKILTPYFYPNFKSWCQVFFHEFGHYIYYAQAEKKADEFEKRLMDRW